LTISVLLFLDRGIFSVMLMPPPNISAEFSDGFSNGIMSGNA